MRAHVITISLALAIASGCGDARRGQPGDTAGGGADADVIAVPDGDDEVPSEVFDVASEVETDDTSDTHDGEAIETPPPERHEAHDAVSGPLRAGVAALPLDVPVGVSMGGYGNRIAGLASAWAGLFAASEGGHGHLMLKAMAFEVGAERLVLLKLPLPFSEDSLTHEMQRVLATEHGLALEGRVITAATHTHHGPARFWRLPAPLGIAGIDSPDDEVIAIIAARMAETVARAVAELAPAEVGFAVVEDWDPADRVYRDRRSVNDAIWGKDPRLTVLGVRRLDGTPLAVMANFGMHGTILGPDNALLSEDAAGGFEQKLEEAFFARHGVPALGIFTQAGGGDAAPAGRHLGHQGEQRMQMVGVAGADAVLDAWQSLTWRSEVPLAVRSRLIDIRHAWIYGDSGEFDQAPGVAFEHGSINCTIDPEEGISQLGEPKRCVGLESLMATLGESFPHPELNQTYLSVARLGDLYLMTIPGEPTHSIADHARRAFAEVAAQRGAALEVMVVGYSQDHLLYFTHPDDWYLGAYEAEFSLWGPWGGRWLVDRQVALATAMIDGFNRPAYYEESPDLSPPLGRETRALEASLAPGVFVVEPPPALARLEVLEVVVGGGDPRLGLPRFELQREHAGAFLPVVGPLATPLDNARYEGLTLYRPEPPMSREILEARDHRWAWRLQVPPWLPLGRYRVVASGRARQTELASWSAASTTFDLVEAPDVAIAITPIAGRADAFALRMTHAPAPLVTAEAGRRPESGWQVFDPGVRHDARIRVQAPLRVHVEIDGELAVAPRIVDWDEALGGHVLDLAPLGLAGSERLRVRVALAQDPDEAGIWVELP